MRGPVLALQYCPEELWVELKNQKAREGVNDARSVVNLLDLIGYVQCSKSDGKQSIMAMYEADFNLYLYA